MFGFHLLLAFLLTPWVQATPVPPQAFKLSRFDPKELLCQLPIVKRFLCPRIGNGALNIPTIIGLARGTADPSGATRFIVKYANAKRWEHSTVVSAWNLPTGSANETVLPMACPQPGVDPSAYNEDCLSMVLYVPPGLTVLSNAPTLVWLHGGSFVVGSATGPGLDGSKLAVATQSIVAVVQYRLGALGFMAPDGKTNLAVKDVVNALQFLNRVAPAFGATTSRITIAGQSAGATMVRALLAAPSAASLFKSAILQSDPMNYGFLKLTTQKTLQTKFNSLVSCGSADSGCWKSLSLDAILNAQDTLFGMAIELDPSTGAFQPIRPVRDGSLITSPLDSTAPFPSVNKPLLVTSVLNEAGLFIYQQFTEPLPEDEFAPICELSLGQSRTSTIVSSPFYKFPASKDGSTDGRIPLQRVGTDYQWRCPGWTFARNWAAKGAPIYVGEYHVGATYAGNDAAPFCTETGSVCHQDDIEIVFGTAPNPTPAQASLITEMQKRYKAFIANGNPNVPGLPTWSPAASSDVHPMILGGTGKVAVGACDPSFWGRDVQYDYQLFNA